MQASTLHKRWFWGLAVFYIAYFAWFSWDFLKIRFSPDEVMNMYVYWHPTPTHFLLSHLLIWRGDYRPMGGLFYLPLMYQFGWNPLPYHVAHLLILLATVFLLWQFARQLNAGLAAASLAALIACYHDGLNQLYNNTAFVYDALCGFFYLAAFVYYLRIRSAGRSLNAAQSAVFLALYLCALNSKEMAVTLPVMLLVYEWLYRDPPPRRIPELWSWVRGPGRGVVLAGALNLPYLYGRIFAPNALAGQNMYIPVFSPERVLAFQTNSLSDLFLAWDHIHLAAIGAIWIAVTWLAWRSKRPVLRFCWFFVLVTPLPIEFIDGRGQATLFIPLFGWAIFASVVFLDLIDALAARAPLPRQATAAILIAAAVSVWAWENRRLQVYLKTALAEMGVQTWDAMQQLQSLHPHVEPRSRVVFLNDPFEDWDMAFIAELWFRDRSVTVRLNRKTPLSPSELAAATHVFEFRQQKLVQLR